MNDAILGGALAMTPALVPTVFVAVYAALFQGVARRGSFEPLCGHCGYPLPAAVHTCPECGTRGDQLAAPPAPRRNLLRATALFVGLEAMLLGSLFVLPERVWTLIINQIDLPLGAGPEVIVFANILCFAVLTLCVWVAVFVGRPMLAGAIGSIAYNAGAVVCAALFEHWSSC